MALEEHRTAVLEDSEDISRVLDLDKTGWEEVDRTSALDSHSWTDSGWTNPRDLVSGLGSHCSSNGNWDDLSIRDYRFLSKES